MTKEEAKIAISMGKKLTHNHFGDDEFVMRDAQDGVIIFEDGVKQVEREFWAFRSGEQWNEGWEIFN